MIRIGLSGYLYQHWRGRFYPENLPQRRWLEFCARHFDTIELNGTFYSLKTPKAFANWQAQVPEDFLFALKGSRYITHNLKLRNHHTALANFLASGLLVLGRQTGPFLWQLPASYHFEPERIEAFLDGLPRTTAQAAEIARDHDHRLKHGSLTEAAVDLPLRHCMEVRHPSYFGPDFYRLLRRYNVALVWADTAGRFPYAEERTADWLYVRLHGSQQLYVSRYSDQELDRWARRLRAFQCDVYVYFDNDGHGHAPYDALRLLERLGPFGSRR